MVTDSTLEVMSLKNMVAYIASLILVMGLFSIVPIGWLERATAQTSSYVLSVTGHVSNWNVNGDWVYLTLDGAKNSVTVTIIRECTGINVLAVICGLIIPLSRVDVQRKLVNVLFSGMILFVMNVSRIILTVYLTGFSVPPFSWFLNNPSIEVFHYPISFAYGVIGVALLILILNMWKLPELGNTLLGIPHTIRRIPEYVNKILEDRSHSSDT
jgi:exosortase/archaeosortase family protein